MNTQPVVFTFGDDKVRLVPEPSLRRFVILLVCKNATGEEIARQIGYLGIYSFTSTTPVYIPSDCSYELVKTFGDQGMGRLIKHCEAIIARNGHT